MKIKTLHPLQWIIEILEDESSFAQKKMFGAEVLYLHGKQMLAIACNGEPWNGLLVCTSREHHELLMKQFIALKPHSVLGKWLYVSQNHPDFEATVSEIVKRVRKNDFRLGVEPKAKVRKKTTKKT